jgi:monoamine oxidase
MPESRPNISRIIGLRAPGRARPRHQRSDASRLRSERDRARQSQGKTRRGHRFRGRRADHRIRVACKHSGAKVTVIEARNRTGGRCLTLRTGDTLIEDKNSDLYSPPGDTQVVRFEHPVGDSEPYLNAGPGRIPSSHRRLLDYLRRFGVAVEIYVMASESNMTQMKGGPEEHKPVVNRQFTHNTRGWIAEMVFQNAKQLLGDSGNNEKRVEQLKSLMVTFGDLSTKGRYIVGTTKPGQDDTVDVSDRAGFTELPGV